MIRSLPATSPTKGVRPVTLSSPIGYELFCCSEWPYPRWNVCSWEQAFLAAHPEPRSCVGAYSLGSDFDAHGIVAEGSPDFCAAADHFIAAGLATGKSNSTCVLTGLTNAAQTQSIDLWVPPYESGTMLRALGDTLTLAINRLMGRLDPSSPAVVECGTNVQGVDAILGADGGFAAPSALGESPEADTLLMAYIQAG